MEKRESRPNPAEHGNWSNRLILTPPFYGHFFKGVVKFDQTSFTTPFSWTRQPAWRKERFEAS
jgi:hypothetical protein